MNLPLKHFSDVWHVGFLDPTKKKKGSYEGSGLSVSINPSDWMQIARLEGSVYRLRKEVGLFLDFHRLSLLEIQGITAWGLENEWIEEKELFRVFWFDDEWNQDFEAFFLTEKEALLEADNYETPVKKISKHILTKKAEEKTMCDDCFTFSFDLLTTIYVEEEMNIDGVWWSDKLDVSRLSAPRGVIIPSKVNEWQVDEIVLSSYHATDIIK